MASAAPSPSVLTRSRSKPPRAPRDTPLDALQASATPRPRRMATVPFGSPMSALRPALGDVTNDSPVAGAAPQEEAKEAVAFGTPVAYPKKGGVSPKSSRATRSSSRLNAQKQAGADEVKSSAEAPSAAESKAEMSAEDVLRSEVTKIMAQQPEVTETPQLGKKKSQEHAKPSPPQAKPGQDAASAAKAAAPRPSLQDSAEKLSIKGRGAGLFPSNFLAPTPVNTPISSAPRPLPERHVAISDIPALTIATPVGKTPPPPFNRMLADMAMAEANDPAHLLQAIAAVQKGEVTSPSSSPERSPCALKFDSPEVNRSLPVTPVSRGSSASGRRGARIVSPGVASSAKPHALPASPAWSLDVNISTPAGTKQVEEIQRMRQRLEQLDEEGWECEAEGAEYDDWQGEDDLYDAEYDAEGEEEGDAAEELSHLHVTGRSAPLRGLPKPSGKHIHFDDSE